MTHYEFIKSRMTTRALLEGLAEESAELAQAALKVVRAAYGENPTPLTTEEARDKMVEEMIDVMMYCEVLLNDQTTGPQNPKWKRWAERLGYGKE